jgi:hypothetical protein
MSTVPGIDTVQGTIDYLVYLCYEVFGNDEAQSYFIHTMPHPDDEDCDGWITDVADYMGIDDNHVVYWEEYHDWMDEQVQEACDHSVTDKSTRIIDGGRVWEYYCLVCGAVTYRSHIKGEE